ncbi:hypothetical protein Syun_022396 [Stephania yunnanensis]|uniref:Arf-GAP domain-containing protein n=1 Tax=Stephania yunnanensis TaxID=152371 RepID=A0AAP0F9G4_9MAGN
MSIEAKKKYEFLESFSAIMDAHLRYFKQGYELLNQMEPFIHQVLTYAQQSKEMANIEQDRLAKRIQEFRTQSELESLRASSNIGVSTTGDYIRNVQSNKNIEALMQSTANGEGFQSLQSTATSEPGTGVFGRFRTRHQKAPSLSKENLGFRTVDLCVSTIKIDAEHTDLRLCFRIISPSKTYTLQHRAGREDAPVRGYAYGSGCDLSVGDAYRRLEDDTIKGQDDALRILREISGNDLCAECGAPDPDWASLNLGILLCIECSGAHRNLGVHISKVRSITLDVKVWESTVLDLFRGLGNAYCNSVWEEMLQHQHERTNESDSVLLITKPGPTDPVAKKEKYIHAKYVEKLFINREATDPEIPSSATRIWEAVKSKDIREVYHLIVASDANINTSYDEVNGCDLCHLLSAAEFQNELKTSDKSQYDPALCQRIKESNDLASCLQGWSLLHLACHDGDWVMVELLLLFGADINKCDFHGRTPLHHCVSRGNNSLAKYLLRRGARSSLKDGGGLTALERAMERGAITDERLFILLTERE